MAIKTTKATIQMRKGLERDFDADKMTAGEWAVSTDTKYVRMCFAPGIVVRMATYEAFEQDMEEIQTILATCQDIQEAVDAMASLVEQHKNAAANSASAAAKSEQNAANYAQMTGILVGQYKIGVTLDGVPYIEEVSIDPAAYQNMKLAEQLDAAIITANSAAETATAQASAAASSEGNAATYAANAERSAANAAASKTAAAQSATDSATSAQKSKEYRGGYSFGVEGEVPYLQQEE